MPDGRSNTAWAEVPLRSDPGPMGRPADAHRPATTRWDVFLAAGLRQAGCLERNRTVIDVVRRLGLSIFAPQIEMPLDTPLTDVEVVRRNRDGILGSAVVLCLPEGAGSGVYYEWGLADGLGKEVVGYSSTPVVGFGKAIDGRWQLLPADRKANTVPQLRAILQSICRRPSN